MIPSLILAATTFTGPSQTQDLPGPPEPKPPGTSKPASRPPAPMPRGRLVIPPSDQKEDREEPSGEYYFYPGVVGIKEGKWSGGDNFLNLSRSLAVQVNILKPQEESLPLNPEELKQQVQQVLESNGFSIRTSGFGGKPPEPFFNLLVMVYPQKKGFAAAIVGRLFEDAKPERFNLSKDTAFQAITWEQINLIVGAIDEMPRLVEKSVDSLVNNFAKKVSSFRSTQDEGRIREPERF